MAARSSSNGAQRGGGIGADARPELRGVGDTLGGSVGWRTATARGRGRLRHGDGKRRRARPESFFPCVAARQNAQFAIS